MPVFRRTNSWVSLQGHRGRPTVGDVLRVRPVLVACARGSISNMFDGLPCYNAILGNYCGKWFWVCNRLAVYLVQPCCSPQQCLLCDVFAKYSHRVGNPGGETMAQAVRVGCSRNFSRQVCAGMSFLTQAPSCKEHVLQHIQPSHFRCYCFAPCRLRRAALREGARDAAETKS